jgi:predicted dehydrogenase
MQKLDRLPAMERLALEEESGAPAEVGALRAGIVGAGFAGRIHARSARLAGARLAGVAASSPESATAAGRELGAEHAFANAQELIASDEVDVVHVCTPNHLHLPLATAALEAGKHVVCEKPVALDAAGASQLLEAARAAGTVVTVPFVYRYYPTIREARARLRANQAGDVRLIQGGYLQDWLARDDDDNWRVDTDLGGASRAFADIGSHWADLVEFVSGQRITALVAQTLIAHEQRHRRPGARSFERSEPDGALREVRTEDVATVLFRTDGGAVGSVTVSQISPGRKNRLWFEISSTEAALAFDQERPETLWVGARSGATIVARDAETLKPEAEAYVTLPAGHPQGYHDCFDAFVAETYAAIRDSREVDGLPGVADGLRAARLTEAVLKSAREQRWVEVGE